MRIKAKLITALAILVGCGSTATSRLGRPSSTSPAKMLRDIVRDATCFRRLAHWYGIIGALVLGALLAGCDPITLFKGRVRSPAACGDEAPGVVAGAAVVVSCPRAESFRIVPDADGEFSLKWLSLRAGGCSFRAVKQGYRGTVFRFDGTCDACTVEVPLVLECAPEDP